VTARRIDLDVDGVVRTVQVENAGDRFTVTIDGRTHIVNATEVEPGRWSLLMDGSGASHDVRVRTLGPGEMSVKVDGASIPIGLRVPRRSRRAHAAADGPVRVVAPMPGKIVRLLVAPGDAVAVRQGLVVVEAMKMENELRAPRAGTVSEVTVEEGAVVELGAVLVTIA
jgi:biotin carboxyl carrier protein